MFQLIDIPLDVIMKLFRLNFNVCHKGIIVCFKRFHVFVFEQLQRTNVVVV